MMVLLWITWLSLYISHLFCDVMKSFTLAYGWLTSSTCKFNISRRLWQSSQLSNWNRILSPFPNFHLISCRRRCLQWSTFRHIRESVPFLVYSSKEVLHKYLFFMACTKREDSLVKIRQSNLHWKASLTAFDLQSPRPPFVLRLHILSHAISGRPFAEDDFF